MAKCIYKSNVAVSLNSGRVGNVRYYTKDGNTYTRTTTSGVSNPRTRSQMRGRTRMVNILHVYTLLKEFCRHLYEPVGRAVSTYNMFVRNAMQCRPVYLTKTQAEQCASVAASYCVSSGSLRPVMYWMNSDGVIESDLCTGEAIFTPETTIGELADALVQNNAGRIEYGDTISFVALLQTGDNAMPYADARCFSIELERGGEEQIGEDVYKAFASSNGHLSMAEAPKPGCYGWIHSRMRNDKLRVSTQYLFDANRLMTNRFSSDEAFEDSINSYA